MTAVRPDRRRRRGAAGAVRAEPGDEPETGERRRGDRRQLPQPVDRRVREPCGGGDERRHGERVPLRVERAARARGRRRRQRRSRRGARRPPGRSGRASPTRCCGGRAAPPDACARGRSPARSCRRPRPSADASANWPSRHAPEVVAARAGAAGEAASRRAGVHTAPAISDHRGDREQVPAAAGRPEHGGGGRDVPTPTRRRAAARS